MIYKTIVLSDNPIPFFDTVKYREVYKKHKEFKELTNYSDKLQFWFDNELFGGYHYILYKNKTDKKPKEFSLIPQNEDENKLFNSTVFKIYFDGGLELKMKEITETINNSPLPTEYINDSISIIETKVNEYYNKQVKNTTPEINSFNAYWYGYQGVKNNTTEKLFSMDAEKTVLLLRPFARGAIDAHIKAFLLEKLNNPEKITTPPPPPQAKGEKPIKDITPLIPLMNTTDKKEFISVINSIYDLVKYIKEKKRADKKKVRYTTHLLIEKGWLIDSNSNKNEYIKTILEYFGYVANSKDFESFEYPIINDLVTPDNNKKYNSIYTIIKDRVNANKVH